MLTNRLTGILVAGLAALFVAVTLPGSGVHAQSPTATPTPAPCPTGVSLVVNAPTASAPAVVTVGMPAGITLKPASANDRNSFHLHYFIDTQPTLAGSPVPLNNPNVIHTDSTSVHIGARPSGTHSVTVVLGQVNHVACQVRGNVTFTLAQATTATPTPSPAPTATPKATSTATPTPAATATPKATATATPKATTAPTSPTAAPKATTAPSAPKSGTGGYLGEQSSRWGIAIVLAVAALGAAGAGRIVSARKQ